MKVTIVGSSPAWPNPGSAQSGYLIEGPGRVLLDCGPGVLGRLRVHEPWPQLDAIVITHFHPDHFGDLVPWAWGSRYGPGVRSPKPHLFVPPGGTGVLNDIGACLDAPALFSQAFDISEYSGSEAFFVAGFDVRAIPVPHYAIAAYALRITDGHSVLAYSGDCGPCDGLAEIAREADLFLCEATLLETEPEPRGHLTLEEAAAAFEASAARRLLLTHRPSEQPVGEGFELAYDGLVLHIA